jgi:hypothetical protein
MLSVRVCVCVWWGELGGDSVFHKIDRFVRNLLLAYHTGDNPKHVLSVFFSE